jgi:O-methyltransferase
MFKLQKVKKARKRLQIITNFLFKLFQLNLRYKENRSDYGIEIFEYFYLPWRSDTKFNNFYEIINDYTLNPKSRLYTLYDFSKRYINDNTTFIEVGCWNGGASALVALANTNKKADFILCDTFTGVTNISEKDSFFKGDEYSDASIDNIKNLEIKTNMKFEIVSGNFPGSMKNIKIKKPISFAHIDVDTYISAKESFYFIASRSKKGAVIVLDDYGGWFTDGATKFGNELKKDKDYFVVPNHLGQLIIYKL